MDHARRIAHPSYEADSAFLALEIRLQPLDPSRLHRQLLRLLPITPTARRELAWFFSLRQASDPDSAYALRAIGAWFAALAPHHRGVLALCHDRRAWPEALALALGEPVALVVRVASSACPGTGTREALDQAAAQRLCRQVIHLDGGIVVPSPALAPLEDRAARLRKAAYRAYARVRGCAPEVLDAERRPVGLRETPSTSDPTRRGPRHFPSNSRDP